MESENGVAVEDEKHVIGETTKENLNKEVENDGKGTEIQAEKEASKPKVEAEDRNSAGAEVAVEASSTSSASKNSKRAKEPVGKAGIASKNNKATKDKPNLKGQTSLSQKQRPTLSQSLSFPAKSTREDGMQKNIDGYLVKTQVKRKHAQGNGITAEASIRHSNKSTNSEVNSKEAKTNTASSNQKTSLTSMPSCKRSVLGKSTLVNALGKSHISDSEASLPVDQISNPAKTAKPSKEDDDSHSTTSSVTPRRRSSGSGFSFRLEERAEKRKEFFSKLEEKVQAKEAEKTNQQAKSMENQVAEIKQLRKSMTFKATPMPSFYKGPPPKVELKKIPTTRPRSPKLGRHKGSSAMSNNINAEGDKSCSSPHGKQQHNDSNKAQIKKGDKDHVISKKPIRKTQPKLHSQETATTKTQGNSNEECHHVPVNNSECKNDMELESEKDLSPDSALVLNSPIPELVSYEVTVGV